MAEATNFVDSLVTNGAIVEGSVNYNSADRKVEIDLVTNDGTEPVEVSILIGDKPDDI